MDAFTLSFGIIFLAELGDKSQLMAMTFATRYRTLTVLAAITAATAVTHLLSVAVGSALGAALPTDAISVVAGIAFLVFAGWTVRGDELTDSDTARAQRSGRSVFWTVALVFFLAELGDKTMFATVTLAADNDAVGTWIGSTLGMVQSEIPGGATCRRDRGCTRVIDYGLVMSLIVALVASSFAMRTDPPNSRSFTGGNWPSAGNGSGARTLRRSSARVPGGQRLLSPAPVRERRLVLPTVPTGTRSTGRVDARLADQP